MVAYTFKLNFLRNTKKLVLLGMSLLSLTCSSQLFAQWRCSSNDRLSVSWNSFAPTQIGASDLALAYCQRNSARPNSCVVNRCYNASLTPPPPAISYWQCKSNDGTGAIWFGRSASTAVGQKNIAITNALANCRAGSSLVRGCFVPPHSCNIVNPTQVSAPIPVGGDLFRCQSRVGFGVNQQPGAFWVARGRNNAAMQALSACRANNSANPSLCHIDPVVDCTPE